MKYPTLFLKVGTVVALSVFLLVAGCNTSKKVAEKAPKYLAGYHVSDSMVPPDEPEARQLVFDTMAEPKPVAMTKRQIRKNEREAKRDRRHQRKRDRKNDRRAFVLEKDRIKEGGKTDRVEAKQAGRSKRVQERQTGKNVRTETRQNGNGFSFKFYLNILLLILFLTFVFLIVYYLRKIFNK